MVKEKFEKEQKGSGVGYRAAAEAKLWKQPTNQKGVGTGKRDLFV